MIRMHIRRGEIRIKFRTQIQTESERRSILRGADRRHAVFSVQFLGDSQRAQRVRIHFIHEGDSCPLTCRRIIDAEITPAGLSPLRCAGNCCSVHFHLAVHRRVHAAFRDGIGNRFVGKRNLRNFTRLQQENILIADSVNLEDRSVLHRSNGVFVPDRNAVRTLLSVFLREQTVFFSPVISLSPVPDLIRKFRQYAFRSIDSGELFAQFYRARLDRGQIEPHMQIRCAGAALHVKDAHGVCGIRLENILSAAVLLEYPVDIGLCFRLCMSAFCVIVIKDIPERHPFSVNRDFAGAEVDAAGQRTVDTAQIDDQFAVYIEPEIVVSGELVDDIMSPGIQSVGRLGERRFDRRTEIIIGGLHEIHLLILSGIGIRQFIHERITQVFPIHGGENTCLQIIVRHELSVLERIPAASVHRSQFSVNLEIP